MTVPAAAAGMLMATAAEAPLGREKKRKKRALEGGSNARPSVSAAILVRRFDPPAQQGEKSAAE
jgi:hypothetical protein